MNAIRFITDHYGTGPLDLPYHSIGDRRGMALKLAQMWAMGLEGMLRAIDLPYHSIGEQRAMTL